MLTAPILTATPYAVRVDYAPGRAVLAVTTPPDAAPDHLTTDTFHTRRRARAALTGYADGYGPTVHAPLYTLRLTESDEGRAATFATRRHWRNVADAGHPLAGQTRHYITTDAPGPVGHDVILAPGHAVDVVSVFRHWNGPGGPTLAYVRSRETGQGTHVPVAELV